MGTALPVDLAHFDKTKVHLVDKRRGLESMPGLFAGHVAVGRSMEFFVNEGGQFLQGFCVASTPCLEKFGYVVGSWNRHGGIVRDQRAWECEGG